MNNHNLASKCLLIVVISGVCLIFYLDTFYSVANTARGYYKYFGNKYKDTGDVDYVTDWRFNESIQLGDLVQRRLEYLQNPKDCHKAKKLVCSFDMWCGSGIACRLHFLTNCLIVAYGTGRTLIVTNNGWPYKNANWGSFFKPFSNCTLSKNDTTGARPWNPGWADDSVLVLKIPHICQLNPFPKFMPMAVPEDLAERLQRFHGYPAVWWLGQLLKFITRPQEDFLKKLEKKGENMNFKRPIVGVHIRRTDKLNDEAKFHSVKEYMQRVETWFNDYETRHGAVTRRVYLATDDPAAIKEAQQKYSNYTFVTDLAITQSAHTNKGRYSGSALTGILTDIYFLSICDFQVVTFSSNVGRVVYMLMQTMHGDASEYAKSVDHVFHYLNQRDQKVTAIETHSPAVGQNELEFRPGDVIKLEWEIRGDNYLNGTNTRTGKAGVFPFHKTRYSVLPVKMPTYPEVKEVSSDHG